MTIEKQRDVVLPLVVLGIYEEGSLEIEVLIVNPQSGIVSVFKAKPGP
jgi:hypothetical protein